MEFLRLNFLTILITMSGWLVAAYHKHRAERFALYDRHMKIFDGFRSFLSKVVTCGNASQEELNYFMENTRETRFLLGKDFDQLRSDIYQQTIQLQILESSMSGRRVNSPEELLHYQNEHPRLFNWFSDAIADLQIRFEKRIGLTTSFFSWANDTAIELKTLILKYFKNYNRKGRG